MRSSEKSANYTELWKDPELLTAIDRISEETDTYPQGQVQSLPIHQRAFISDQVKGRFISELKFTHLAGRTDILYPPSENLEQSSSSLTASYKASLFGGDLCLDLTGGFGVDTYYFAKHFDSVVFIEQNQALYAIAKQNLQNLGVKNVGFQNKSAEEVLKNFDEVADLIYLDPSRRSRGQRLKDLDEYSPKIPEVYNLVSSKCRNLLIKFSPISDLNFLAQYVPGNKEIYVLSLKNECKEVLLHCASNLSDDLKVHCIDLRKNGQISYQFSLSEEKLIPNQLGRPENYIYLPMTAIVKAGAYRSLARDYKLKKISNNSHVYTGKYKLPDFPGQSFELISTIRMKKEDFKEKFNDHSFTVHARNFHLQPSEILTKLKLKEGNDLHLIACRDQMGKTVLLVTKKLTANE
ncbi:MAG: RsmD family RNA methyltransferase [Vicingaceae bacterium]